MAHGNGKCKFCEEKMLTKEVHCVRCKKLFHLLLEIRKIKRKTPRIGYKRILLKVKYLEVLEAMK